MTENKKERNDETAGGEDACTGGNDIPDSNSSSKLYKFCGENNYTYNYDGLEKYPSIMTDAKQWCARYGKVPYVRNPDFPKRLSSSWKDSANWLTFNEAMSAYNKRVRVQSKERKNVQIDGIGYLVSENSSLDLVLGDIDCCRDPETGQISPFALEMLKVIKPFITEVSLSECGIRFVAIGKISVPAVRGNGPQDDIPEETQKRIISRKPAVQSKLDKEEPAWNGIEVYYRENRHLTLTGIRINELCFPMEDRSKELEEFLNPFILIEEIEKRNKGKPKSKGGRPKNKNGNKTLPQLGILKVIDTTHFRKIGKRWVGSHPALGSTTGSNLVLDEELDTFANMHNGLKNGGDAWVWLAMEAELIDWEADGVGALDDPDVMKGVKEYAIQKGYFTAKELEEQSPKRGKKDPKKILNEIIINEINKHPSNQIFFGDNEQAYLWIADEDGSNRVCKTMGNRGFYKWLLILYWKRTGEVIADRTVKDIDMGLEIICEQVTVEKGLDPKIPVFYVTGKTDDKTLWYDLGREDWKGIKITEDGWTLEDLPVGFVRVDGYMEQVIPEIGGNIDDIFKYVYIQDKNDKILFKTDLITAFIPSIEHPISYFTGEKGATKTSNTKFMVDMINPINLITGLHNWNDRKVDDISLALSCYAAIGIDNLSDINGKFADTMCMNVTGGKTQKRSLYTNGDLYEVKLRAKIIANGIPQIGLDRTDLLDRMITYELAEIKEENRIEITELRRRYYEDKPKILGAIFDHIVIALKNYERIKKQKRSLPRLGDFAVWGEVISQSCWNKKEGGFLRIYNEEKNSVSRDAVQNSEIACAIKSLLLGDFQIELPDLGKKENGKTWKGTGSELLTTLSDGLKEQGKYPSADWPKNASILSQELKRVGGDLKSVGISIERKKSNGDKLLVITYRPPVEDQTSGEEECAAA